MTQRYVLNWLPLAFTVTKTSLLPTAPRLAAPINIAFLLTRMFLEENRRRRVLTTRHCAIRYLHIYSSAGTNRHLTQLILPITEGFSINNSTYTKREKHAFETELLKCDKCRYTLLEYSNCLRIIHLRFWKFKYVKVTAHKLALRRKPFKF